MMHRNMDAHNHIAALVKLKDLGRKIQQKIVKKLNEQQDEMEELQSVITLTLTQK